jgi:hypothetical protein
MGQPFAKETKIKGEKNAIIKVRVSKSQVYKN